MRENVISGIGFLLKITGTAFIVSEDVYTDVTDNTGTAMSRY